MKGFKNGKVKCVGYKRKERYFTVGKIYEVHDGRINTGDYVTSRYGDIESLSSGIGWKFIECVE